MAKRTDPRFIWLLPLAALLLGFLGRTLYYYRGFYFAPNVPTDQAEKVDVQIQAPAGATIEPGTLSGLVLVDNAHANDFTSTEMTVLFGRIAAAGGEVQLYEGEQPLEAALHGARALVVAVNQQPFEAADAAAVQAFVRDGGRLLLIGDPTRLAEVNTINSLAGHFAVLYQDDYIYNLVENDASYLNVFLRDFAEDALTEGVDELVVRGAGSLRASEGVLLSGDKNTYSSLREAPGGVAAVALTSNGNVLALPDLTFLTPPYNTFADNDRFIDNIVSFLLAADRDFQLLDFPSLFSGPVDLVYSSSQLLENGFADANQLRSLLAQAGAQTELKDTLIGANSAVVVGLFSSLDRRTEELLSDDGIFFTADGGQVTLVDVGQFNTGYSVLFHLHRSESEPYQLFILAESDQSLHDGLALLFSGRVGDCLLTGQTALCTSALLATPTATERTTETPQETPQETPTGSGTPSATPTATSTPSG